MKLHLMCSFAALAVGLTSPALAQPDQAGPVDALPADGQLEEIVVTAQRREESMQKVGISITAFSGQQLQELGVSKSTDIVMHTPNMRLYEYSPAATIYNLRGVSQNSFADHLEAPVAVYVDDAYVSALGALSAPIYDLERVEVLRGPQGTLYGRNVTGGLINYISKTPGDTFDGYVQGSIGRFDTYEIEGAVGGPLSSNVSARIAGKYRKADGYMESLVPGVRDSQGANAGSVRASLQFKPTSNFTLLAIGSYTKDDDVPTGNYVYSPATRDPATGLGIYVNRPTEPWQFSADYQGFFNRDLYSGTVKAIWELSPELTLTSITNYLDLKKSYGEDADATTDPVFVYGIRQKLRQFSQEMRIAGDHGDVTWQAGAYYLHISSDNATSARGFIAAFTDAATGTPADTAISSYTLRTSSWSLFGQGDVRLTDTLKLTLGARYTYDTKKINLFSRYQHDDGAVLLAQSDIPGLPIGPVCFGRVVDTRCPGDVVDPDARQTMSDWAGKVQLDWTPVSNVLVYGSISRGIKAGNYSTPLFPDAILTNGLAVLKHRPETLTAYEIGFKTNPARRLRFNGAFFYYDYKDYQAFSLLNFVQSVTNNDATIKGAEFELAWTPLRGLNLNLGASLLDTKVRGVKTPSGALIDTQAPQAPHESLNGSAQYEFALGPVVAFLQGDFVYNADQFLEVTNAEVDREPGYFVANAQVGVHTSDDKYRLSFWVRNLGNKAYRIYGLDASGAPNPFVQDVFAPPRTYGVTATARF